MSTASYPGPPQPVPQLGQHPIPAPRAPYQTGHMPLPPSTPPPKSKPPATRGLVLTLFSLLLALVVILGGTSGYLLLRLNSAESDVQNLSSQLTGVVNPLEVAEKVLPSVFTVETGDSRGTAFAFNTSDDGGTVLVTAYHVVEDAIRGSSRARLLQNEETYDVTILGGDKDTDIAFLETSESFPMLQPFQGEPQPGEGTVAIGAPLGANDTVTAGIVSAYREVWDVQFVQTDAAISPGNSGGPLVNRNGEVLGVVSWTFRPQVAENLAFAVSITYVCDSDYVIC